MRSEVASFVIALGLMTAVFSLIIYYLIPMPFDKALISGFVVSLVTVMFHEIIHRQYAIEFCERRAVFTITKFAVVVTLVSIVILVALIFIKKTTGWYTYFIPIVASPGGVYVMIRKSDKCYDNIAVVAPLYNLVVGVIATIYLFSVTDPPFILNDVSNFGTSLIALVAYFSFALAFINALPLRFGDVATDGYWALTVDKSDFLTKMLDIAIVLFSAIVLFASNWWAIQI